MTDEVFAITLAGRSWSLPHLPFRLVKSIQPSLFKAYADASQGGDKALSEAQIDNLGFAAWKAISHVDPSLTYEDFSALPFSVADLLAALPAVARAAGLRVQAAAAEAPPAPGKSTSTP